jgi:hypothetical protein
VQALPPWNTEQSYIDAEHIVKFRPHLHSNNPDNR